MKSDKNKSENRPSIVSIDVPPLSSTSELSTKDLLKSHPLPPTDILGSSRHSWLEKVQGSVVGLAEKYGQCLKRIVYGLTFTLYAIFLAFALRHDMEKAAPLAVATLCLFAGLLYFKVLKVKFGQTYKERVGEPVTLFFKNLWHMKTMRRLVYILTTLGICAYLIIDTADNRYRLMPLVGLAFFVFICFIFSTNPAQVKWRPVLCGLGLQFTFGLLVLRWQPGYLVLETVANNTVAFLDYAQYGTKFVYGFVADPPAICGITPVFAFTVIQTLLYFGSIIAILYYFGIIQFLLYQLAWLMQCTLGTTAAESLNAAGCIFLGMTEAPLMISPYFSKMTKSELHTVFASGFACIAGSLFIAYISFGACPVYLISACLMSAPASIAASKLLLPETEESQLKKSSDLYLPPSKEVNVIEAISQGASCVIDVIVQIIGNLIVFVALLTFIDHAVWYFFNLIGWDINFQNILGYVFFPLAFIMGASDAPEWDARVNETMIVAQLMGTKTVINEFIAYKNMGVFVNQNLLKGRAQMIATFALCGFSNLASIGIQLGTIGSLCPEKKPVVASVIVRALAAGAISCFMTACVAGIIVKEPLNCYPVLSAQKCMNLSQFII